MVFHQLSFHKTFWPHERGKKNPLAVTDDKRESERARAIPSLSLSRGRTQQRLFRERVLRARLSVVSLTGDERGGKVCDTVFFLWKKRERVKNTRTNERKRVVFLLKKKKKKEESKFFTRTLSHKESLCLCVSVSLSRARVRERERESRTLVEGYVEGTGV